VTLRNYQPVAWVLYQRVIDQSKADIFIKPGIISYDQICKKKVLICSHTIRNPNWSTSEMRKNCVTRHKTASTNDGLPEISKMNYWNRIPEPGTTISGFADNKKKKKIMSTGRP
jgi:hypothetical protein